MSFVPQVDIRIKPGSIDTFMAMLRENAASARHVRERVEA